MPDAPRWSVPHLHDNVVQIAAANGVFAAAAYLALVGARSSRARSALAAARATARTGRRSGRARCSRASALTVAGFFEYNFGDTEVEMATLLVFAVPVFGAPRKRGGD